jgi:hypothetical protein
MTIDKKIVWLASYPKSGNTWFRLFLTALLNEGELDINQIKTDGQFTSRYLFDSATDLDSAELFEDEVRLLLPDVYTYLSSGQNKQHLFIKVHDAYTLNANHKSIVPSAPTLAAIYFIRNPLDVVGSFAHHSNATLDEAIKVMNNDNGKIGELWKGSHLISRMLNWSAHVESWTKNMPFPVLVVRYEDMVLNTIEIFARAVAFLGLDVSAEQIEVAINKTSFQNLRKLEAEQGFKEGAGKKTPFFRAGKIGNWYEELSRIQVEAILKKNEIIMKQYHYI